MPGSRLVMELMKRMSAAHCCHTKTCTCRLSPPLPLFPPSPSAPLRQRPYSVTNRGWLLCQESGSRGVLKAGFLSLLCGCQEEKCEQGIASIVTKVCWGTGRGVLPHPSGAGLLSQPSHGCWTGGNETEQDFCAPVEGKWGSEVVP